MFWFGRPPMLRRVGAVLLVLGALVVELWPSSTVQFPFATEAAAPGEPVVVEWRPVPAGLLVPPVLTGMVAAHPIERGEPVTASDLQLPVGVPAGWWALTVEMPAAVAPGSETRLVLGDGTSVPGLVVANSASGPFDSPSALVAVPGEEAARVAAAAGARQVVVLVAP